MNRENKKEEEKMEEVENVPETHDDESDSDEDMDDGDAKDNERINELEGILKENPYDYQVSVLLIIIEMFHFISSPRF